MNVIKVGAPLASPYETLAQCYERAAQECSPQQLRAFLLGQASRLLQGPVEVEIYATASARFLDQLLQKKPRQRGLHVLE